jgi:hypothetical protein
MTGEILDSDIEFAQRLLGEGRSDEQITKALSLRGAEPSAAAGLVTRLRRGQKMRPDMILLPKRASQRALAQ